MSKEPSLDELDATTIESINKPIAAELRELKLLLAEAILTEANFESGGIDLTESISLLQQASEQSGSAAVLMTSLASVMSTNAALKTTSAALSKQVAFKDEAIAKALMLLEKIVPN